MTLSWMELDDGGTLGIPLAWLPPLLHGTAEQCAEVCVSPNGPRCDAGRRHLDRQPASRKRLPSDIAEERRVMIEAFADYGLTSQLYGGEHANFFEQSATKYFKVEIRASRNEVRAGFGKRPKAKARKAANEYVALGSAVWPYSCGHARRLSGSRR